MRIASRILFPSGDGLRISGIEIRWEAQNNQEPCVIIITLHTFSALAVVISLAACSAEPKTEAVSKARSERALDPAEKVVRTDAEWKELLTPEQYQILRESGTERPFGKAYEEFKQQGEGAYHCAGCDALLFSSNEKFDSGCGWPSFYDPAKADNVTLKTETSMGMARTEVICAKCGGHLGHVFEGERLTDKNTRHCVNSLSMVFYAAGDEIPATITIDDE